MDGRKNNGGHSNGGRKPKAEEVKLIERLTPLEPQAYAALKKGIETGDFKFIQMFFSNESMNGMKFDFPVKVCKKYSYNGIFNSYAL